MLVCVGQVTGAHGVRGLVKLTSFTSEPAAVAAYGPLTDESGTRRFALALKGQVKGHFLAAIEGVQDRDVAEALAGTRLFVERDRLPAADEEEFYHADLIGLAAVTPDGVLLGRVAALHNFGAGDLVEIALEGGGRPLLPFDRLTVPEIDIAGGRIVIDPPAGLLDREAQDGAA
jgi:16S rRNA processing protein RimM